MLAFIVIMLMLIFLELCFIEKAIKEVNHK